ncbi:MAG: serine/threonine protein kinase, partial [Myxococcales bacterium]|nr:serine/threonine protein kinase [Myxococcales bacterium]
MEVSLDGYRVERLIRSSATTRVWQALREQDGQAVVIKAFSTNADPGLEARVEREFELIRRLELPGIVRALALEHAGSDFLLILEAHPGTNLSQHTQGRPLAIDAFFAIACQIATILAAVHEQRVIHRDLKPTNILIDGEGRVAIADFGISVVVENERDQIHDQALLSGTLPYMSPEQTGRTGREVDFRSDLYSLGVTFYELLTGRRPLQGQSSLELIHAHLARRPTPPEQLRPELPGALSQLLMKLLEKAPERRYQTARGLLHDLEQLRARAGQSRLGDGDDEDGDEDAPF